jgi:hypothetical protein
VLDQRAVDDFAAPLSPHGVQQHLQQARPNARMARDVVLEEQQAKVVDSEQVALRHMHTVLDVRE